MSGTFSAVCLRTGKLIYTKFEGETGYKNGRTLWYVDFSEDSLIERMVIRDSSAEPRNASISPDGRWVVYNTLAGLSGGPPCCSKTYICPLEENTQTRIFIGNGAQPYWWTKPGTNSEYIIYCTGDIEEPGMWQQNFPSTQNFGVGDGGATFCQLINSSSKNPIGNQTTLLSHYSNGGRSSNGAWLFASSRATGIYHIDSLATSNATVIGTPCGSGHRRAPAIPLKAATLPFLLITCPRISG